MPPCFAQCTPNPHAYLLFRCSSFVAVESKAKASHKKKTLNGKKSGPQFTTGNAGAFTAPSNVLNLTGWSVQVHTYKGLYYFHLSLRAPVRPCSIPRAFTGEISAAAREPRGASPCASRGGAPALLGRRTERPWRPSKPVGGRLACCLTPRCRARALQDGAASGSCRDRRPVPSRGMRGASVRPSVCPCQQPRAFTGLLLAISLLLPAADRERRGASLAVARMTSRGACLLGRRTERPWRPNKQRGRSACCLKNTARKNHRFKALPVQVTILYATSVMLSVSANGFGTC